MTQAVKSDPIVILRSANSAGETFALEPRSRERLRKAFENVHVHPRIFIAHETHADFERIHGDLVPQVVQLLTGVSEERLKPLGGVVFWDPVAERELKRG